MSVRTIVKSIQDIMRQDTGVDGDAQRISQLCWMFFLKIIDDQDQELEITQDGYQSPIPKSYQWRAWAADPEGITGEELLAFVNDDLFPALKNLVTSTKAGDRRRVVKDVFEDAYNYMKSGQLMRQVVNKINGIDFNNLTERQHFGDIYEQVLNDLQSAGNAGEYYTPRALTAFMANRIDPHPGEILFDPACGTGGFLTCALRHMRERYVKRPEHEHDMQAALRATEKKQLPHMLCVTNMLLHGIEDPSFVHHDNTLARPYISYTQSDRVDIVLTNPPFGGREEDGIETNFPAHFRTRETADLFLALIIRLLKPGGRAAVVLPDGTLFGEGVKTRLKEHLMEECNLHTIVRLPNSVFKPYASIGTNLLFFEKGTPTEDIWFWEHRVPEGQKAYSMTKPIRFEHLQGCIDWWGGAKRDSREETPQAWKVIAGEVKARGYNLDIKNPHTVVDDHGDPEEQPQRGRSRDDESSEPVEGDPRGGPCAMNAEGLLAHYERIADAPNAITRLRRFILDLAVRGKLVPQDPRDEPASELLKRIAKEKARLVKAGEIKNVDLSRSRHDIPTPRGWEITNLQSVCASVTDGDHLPPPKAETGIPFLVIGNVRSQRIDFAGCRFVRSQYYEALDPIRRPRKGDLLYTLVGSYGIPVIVRDDRPFCVQRHIGILRPTKLIDVSFLARAMESRLVFDQATACATGIAQKTVSLSGLRSILLLLPPLAEQHRIAAKVNELMALCDRLEVARADREATRDRLTAASLVRLNAPDPETFDDDARFALDALPALTTRPDQINQLRRTIINLAVRGKLVRQNPSDEPASLPGAACDVLPTGMPGSWRYTQLANLLAEDTRNGYSRRPDDAPDGTPILRISAGTIRRDGIVAEEEHKLISGIDAEARLQYGLRSGDLLACRFNGNKAYVGRFAIFNDYLGTQPIYPDKLIRVRAAPRLALASFLQIAGGIGIVRNEIEAACATTVGNWGISASNLKAVRFPVPPLAEQHRIVAKVNELTALCDGLEASLAAGEDIRRRLLDALLAKVLEPVKGALEQAA